jgi:hypothetical protein
LKNNTYVLLPLLIILTYISVFPFSLCRGYGLSDKPVIDSILVDYLANHTKNSDQIKEIRINIDTLIIVSSNSNLFYPFGKFKTQSDIIRVLGKDIKYISGIYKEMKLYKYTKPGFYVEFMLYGRISEKNILKLTML